MTEPTAVEETGYPAEEQAEEAAAGAAEESEVQPELASDVTEEGRYIPYSGGCMGWFENTGVLKCELPNNYTYFTVMASDRVRSKQFERFGERFNRRGDRRRFKRMTGLTLTMGKQSVRGTTRDISRHGVRVQFIESVELNKGDEVKLKVHADEKTDAVALDCRGRVAWCERVGRIRPLWNLGITFMELTAEQEEQLQPMLKE